MTILPKKNKSREQSDQESGSHNHSHAGSREALITSPAVISGQALHHIHNRSGTQSTSAADLRKPAGYPPASWPLPAALDDKINAKDVCSNDLESGPSQSKRRLRSPTQSVGHRHSNRKQLRSHSGKPGTAPTSSDSDDSSGGFNSEDEYGPPAYQDNIEELEVWFEKAIKEKLGLSIKPMEPDGACLFRAVAHQVYGDQDMHGVVRQHCVDYMRKNSDHFSAYVTEDFSSYLDRKKTDSCHGNHVEMQAMSELYNRPVEVYQYSTKPINIYHGAYKVELNYPIRISYHRNVHYNSLVDPYKATVGIGLGLPGHQPGLADKNLMTDATLQSEAVHIEETMLQDKIRETDWERTDDALQEQVARESYLQWLRDNEKRMRGGGEASGGDKATCTSSAAAAAGTSSALLADEHGVGVNWLEHLGQASSPPLTARCVSPRQQPVCATAVAATSSSARLGSPLLGAGCSGLATNVASTSRDAASNTCSRQDVASPQGGASATDFNETASLMNEIPPEILGLTEDWTEDALLAQVIAHSTHEYMETLKQRSSKGTTPIAMDGC